jgi:hypothetical protein
VNRLPQPYRRLILAILIISLLGWIYGGLEMLYIVPQV